MKKKTLSSIAAMVAAVVATGYFAASTHGDKNGGTPGLGDGDFVDVGATEGLSFSLVPGPDVATSRLGLTSGGAGSDDFNYYGSFLPDGQPTTDRIRAFSMASTSCNVGTAVAEWINSHSGSTAGKHPVIMPNVYRYLDGRFEHIGMGWGKHSFCAVSEPTCGSCQATSCATLGIGCADTYWAGLNGGQSDLGPRSQVNPWTVVGEPTHAVYSTPSALNQNSTVAGRLQIKEGEILDTNAGGGRFVAEIHYMTHDEPFENRYNNCSWREVNVQLTSMVGVEQGQESVNFQEPAIFAWQSFDPEVVIKAADVPEDGRFYLGYRVFDNGDGTWRYEYALYNQNSDRSAGGFSIPLDASVTVTEPTFHDVDYHSGDGMSYPQNFDGTDWSYSEGGSAATWSTDSFTSSPNANALRWSTIYNFGFIADAPPTFGQANITLFKPGSPTGIAISTLIPDVSTSEPCDADLSGDDMVGTDDLVQLILAWDTDDEAADLNGDGFVGTDDLVILILAWGPC
ncbi:MAG: hypothetical protein ACYTGC_00630 [Planctomycetota bacterium]|jgi:hypothetical protein